MKQRLLNIETTHADAKHTLLYTYVNFLSNMNTLDIGWFYIT